MNNNRLKWWKSEWKYEKKSKDNIRYVFLAPPSASTRSAHRSSRARAPFHFFLSSGLPFFFPLYPLLLLRDSPFRFFVFLFLFFFSFFPFQRVHLIRAVGFYIFRFVSCFVGGSPRASASFTKKGARREARGEERKYAGSCPTCICDTATSIARENYSRNVREWIEHGANIVGVLEPAITGLTARPRLVHGHFRQPSGGPRGPVSEYI